MRSNPRVSKIPRLEGHAVVAALIASIVGACSPSAGGDANAGGAANTSGGAGASGGASNGGSGNAANGGTLNGSGGGSGATASGGTLGGGGTPQSGGAPATGGVSGAGGSGGGTSTLPLPAFDGGITPNNNAVTAGNICERLAAIQCAAQAHCCDLPDLPSFDACKATQANACMNTAYLDAITANPVAGFDAPTAKDRYTEFERRSSICDTGITAWAAATTTGLRGILLGTKSANANCTSPNLTDKPTDAAYLASCSNPTTACLPGGILGTTWSCAALSDVGGACFTDVNCNAGLYCDNPNATPTGAACKTRKQVGVACVAGNECASLLCRGQACVPATQENVFCLSN